MSTTLILGLRACLSLQLGYNCLLVRNTNSSTRGKSKVADLYEEQTTFAIY